MSETINFTKLADVPTTELQDGLYTLVVKNGQVCKIEGGVGGGSAFDEIVEITAVQVEDPDEEGKYKWDVETSIPVDEIIQMCTDGKYVGAKVTATFIEETEYTVYSIVPLLGIEVTFEEVTRSLLLGSGNIYVSYYTESDGGETASVWDIYDAW